MCDSFWGSLAALLNLIPSACCHESCKRSWCDVDEWRTCHITCQQCRRQQKAVEQATDRLQLHQSLQLTEGSTSPNQEPRSALILSHSHHAGSQIPPALQPTSSWSCCFTSADCQTSRRRVKCDQKRSQMKAGQWEVQARYRSHQQHQYQQQVPFLQVSVGESEKLPSAPLLHTFFSFLSFPNNNKKVWLELIFKWAFHPEQSSHFPGTAGTAGTAHTVQCELSLARSSS